MQFRARFCAKRKRRQTAGADHVPLPKVREETRMEAEKVVSKGKDTRISRYASSMKRITANVYPHVIVGSSQNALRNNRKSSCKW